MNRPKVTRVLPAPTSKTEKYRRQKSVENRGQSCEENGKWFWNGGSIEHLSEIGDSLGVGMNGRIEREHGVDPRRKVEAERRRERGIVGRR